MKHPKAVANLSVVGVAALVLALFYRFNNDGTFRRILDNASKWDMMFIVIALNAVGFVLIIFAFRYVAWLKGENGDDTDDLR